MHGSKRKSLSPEREAKALKKLQNLKNYSPEKAVMLAEADDDVASVLDSFTPQCDCHETQRDRILKLLKTDDKSRSRRGSASS